MPRPKILRSEKLFPFCYIEKILSRKRNFNLIQRLFLIVIPSCTSDETLCDICSNPFFVVISTLHVRQIMWQNQWHTLVTPTEYCKLLFARKVHENIIIANISCCEPVLRASGVSVLGKSTSWSWKLEAAN